MTQTAVKERGILFSTDMVKALPEKTQTRRVIKPQPEGAEYWTPYNFPSQAFYPNTVTANPKILKCPYGQAGDRLWVKETWGDLGWYDGNIPIHTLEGHDRLTHNIIYFEECCGSFEWRSEDTNYTKSGQERSHWKPSIFMPRWASRIDLEITEVRAERVKEISRDDVVAEGLPRDEFSYAQRFMNLWDSLNAKRGYGWETNPWVWVISFKLI